jgi:large subunit ribosomal protein L29
MRNNEIRELSTKEIQDIIQDRKDQLMKMKLAHAVSPLDDPSKLKNTKRTVARLKTELRKRELNG